MLLGTIWAIPFRSARENRSATVFTPWNTRVCRSYQPQNRTHPHAILIVRRPHWTSLSSLFSPSSRTSCLHLLAIMMGRTTGRGSATSACVSMGPCTRKLRLDDACALSPYGCHLLRGAPGGKGCCCCCCIDCCCIGCGMCGAERPALPTCPRPIGDVRPCEPKSSAEKLPEKPPDVRPTSACSARGICTAPLLPERCNIGGGARLPAGAGPAADGEARELVGLRAAGAPAALPCPPAAGIGCEP
jgi:hypothetical protein